MSLVFVENKMQLIIKFDTRIVSDFMVHPNMVVLPAIGDMYSFKDDNGALIGKVINVLVSHTVEPSENGSPILKQVAVIQALQTIHRY